MSLLYGKLNKELKLLGSVQTQLHTHVNMFICKPLDYIMTVHNQYYYYTVNETLKILKHRTPISLHSLFTLSKRPGKETLLILPLPSDSFVYRSSYLWNHARSKFIYADFSKPASFFKSSIKKIIFAAQNLGEPENWCEQQNFLNYSG